MNFDSTVFDLVFHQVTKGAMGLVLLLVVWLYIRTMWIPYFRKTHDLPQDAPVPVPPIFSAILMGGLVLGFVYYVSMEHTFRRARAIPNTTAEDRRVAAEERAAEFTPPVYTPQESLEERTEKSLEANREENEKAKADFLKLPAVESSGDGGAELRE